MKTSGRPLQYFGSLWRAVTQFPLRLCNVHHYQLPGLTPAGRRTPEYREWLACVLALLDAEYARPVSSPCCVGAELGHDAPAYRSNECGDAKSDAMFLMLYLSRVWSTAP